MRHLSVTQNGATTHYNKETTYTYDLRDMLTDVSVKTPQANETTGIVTFNIVGTQNTYNAQGKRVERVENTKTTKFYYTGDALLYSTDAGNVLQTENILDLGGTIIASKRFLDPAEASTTQFANKYYLYNYDVRGSVTNIIGPDGNTVIGYDYDEFGNTQSSGNSSFLNDVTFTSSVADTSSSLQYMNARFYQPSTGRFISQDTYTGNPYDPWTHNLYSYCSANPVNYTDPTGHVMTLAQQLDNLKEQRVSIINEMNRLMEVRKYADPSTDYVGFARNVKVYADAKARLKDLNQRIDDVARQLEEERKYVASNNEVQTFEVGQEVAISKWFFALKYRPVIVFDAESNIVLQHQFAFTLTLAFSPTTSISTYTVLGSSNAREHTQLLGDSVSGDINVTVPIGETGMGGVGGFSFVKLAGFGERTDKRAVEFILGGLSTDDGFEIAPSCTISTRKHGMTIK